MGKAISQRAIVSTIREQISTKLGDEEVILHLQKGTYFGLNEVGAFIWGRIQTPMAVRQILDEMLREFDVDEATCAKDLTAILRELEKKGLIKVRNERVD